ncbi:zinc-binding alcohol dehydrogenase family protein [Nonomuraea glycinis]|uniref:Zinc-binding dehydrogenase n=1 Tax=Nonomuraea glycinis TaxID=2047744 RepID=A0A918AA43_9ACTN|nr:zinc-binding alcohol dehydrogenase family protein [Nonomuraea glycinis]MCA2181212.1 zinc-binding alcohol dehydrogenase family protein [Nonomuraea glycinis]GGP13433.1 zinc-binding dehydrogenase [Nonomuraea glycinis]
MKAAIVNAFGVAPSFQDFREPEAGDGETVVTVHAAPLTPIVRSLAAGRHYTSAASAGFVPGVDGVGVDDMDRRVYFLFPKAPFGSMAEKSLVASHMMVPVPQNLSSESAAAIGAAGLASWVALSRRAKLRAGETVLVIGATGAAGGMAVQNARHFGASRVIAVGRDETRLKRLDADVRIALDDDAGKALRAEFDQGVDVVLDFVWGEPASRVLRAATQGRGSRSGEPRLRYVQLGTMAGDEIPVRGDMLRSTGLELIGSGIGSVAVEELLAGAGELLTAAATAEFDVPFTSLPLRAVADAWNGAPDVRHILTPGL